jgi:hypothetical protein
MVRQGSRGAPCDRSVNRFHHPVLPTLPHTTGESKSPGPADAHTTAKCPTCGAAVPAVPLGRPRTYCSTECRRELPRRRRQLAGLEAELAEARLQRDWHKGVWKERYRRQVAALISMVKEARRRVPDALPISTARASLIRFDTASRWKNGPKSAAGAFRDAGSFSGGPRLALVRRRTRRNG